MAARGQGHRLALIASLSLAIAAPAIGQASVAASAHESGTGSQPRTANPAAPLASTLPSGFTDTTVFSGLTDPTAVRFSPDGRVFVAEKSGVIKVYSSITATTPTVFADLSSVVDDYWDRGLLGLALDPAFPTSPYVYVAYTYDAPVGGAAPVWNDACPSPPGPTTDGCVVSGRLSRLTASGDVITGGEQVLLNDWCSQFPSHSIGDIEFGPDGALYLSGGDGANFDAVDYGQFGGSLPGTPTPANPCGDPPVGVGGTQTPPTAEGGSLRSQSPRRPNGEPVLLDGTIVRIDPSTGAGLPNNPMAGSSDANARRIAAFGFRNPFRFAFRPGTNELWVGDVGASTWEEINRITNPTATPVANGGWPCYEGGTMMSGFRSANLNICNSLYANPTGLLTPYFTYAHSAKVVPGEACPVGSSSITGIAFHGAGGYPAAYDNALVFADYSRNCIWAMQAGSNGLPDPSKVVTLDDGAGYPVDLEIGPGGDVWYVDLTGGKIHRIVYDATNTPPTAEIFATPTSGNVPLTVSLDGTGSSDPDPGDTLTYSWDLDGDGTYGDATLPTASATFSSSGLYSIGLRVTDSHGASDTTTVAINAGNVLPVPVIDTPGPSTTWAVGDAIAFSGHATDSSGQAIPPSGLHWDLTLFHCPSNCHTHGLQGFDGVASGSFPGPDHEYPSYLMLTLTATDSLGRQAATSVRLDPKTATLAVASVPSSMPITVDLGGPTVTPFSTTVIQNSTNTVSAPPSQVLSGLTYTFDHWSDGGAATHTVIVPATGRTLTVTYTTPRITAWLSDLPWTQLANGWGPVEKNTSNGEKAAGDGKPITLNGTVYAKGLGTHAASEVDYAMNGSCSSFTTSVGVDDEVGTKGSITFQIWADATKLADSGVMTGASATQTFTVNVTGATALRLVVTDAANGNAYDHGDWAAAQLTCGSAPPDTTPPTVTGKSPANGATGVSASVTPTATFSEAVDPATLTTTNLTVTPSGGSAVAATVGYDGPSKTATINPTAALAAGTTYTVRVKGGSTGVADLAGNRLAADVTWTFTTAAGGSTAWLSDLPWTQLANGWGPVEKNTSNGEKAAGDGKPITLNGTVYAKGLGTHAASEVDYAMNGSCSSFTTSVGVDDEVGTKGSITFQIWADATKLADSGVMTGASATQTFTVNVTGATALRLVVTDAANGNAYDHGDWAAAQLTCGSAPPDTTPPTVTGKSPANGATGVSASVTPTATFSEAVDPATLTTTNLTVTPSGGSAVAATVGYDGPSKTATINPTAALAAGTTYTVRVKGGSTGVADLAGNRLAADVTWTFTTAAGGSTAWLSDLPWTQLANGWGPVEKNTSNGEKAAGDGKPITLNGTVYAKGLGTHAASEVDYAMNGSCSSFTTSVGVDDEVGTKGSITFQIWADATKLADSGVMTGASATQTFTVNVTGATALRLVVTDAANGNAYDHGDWAAAQLTCG